MFLFNPKPSQPLTEKVAVYPDGTRYVLNKSQGTWWYKRGSGAYPQKFAIAMAEDQGAVIEVQPSAYGKYWERRVSKLLSF